MKAGMKAMATTKPMNAMRVPSFSCVMGSFVCIQANATSKPMKAMKVPCFSCVKGTFVCIQAKATSKPMKAMKVPLLACAKGSFACIQAMKTMKAVTTMKAMPHVFVHCYHVYVQVKSTGGKATFADAFWRFALSCLSLLCCKAYGMVVARIRLEARTHVSGMLSQRLTHVCRSVTEPRIILHAMWSFIASALAQQYSLV